MKIPDKVSYGDLAKVMWERYTEIRHGRLRMYRYCCESCMKYADSLSAQLKEKHEQINRQAEKQNCWGMSNHIPDSKFQEIEKTETGRMTTDLFSIDGSAKRHVQTPIQRFYSTETAFWQEPVIKTDLPEGTFIEQLKSLPGTQILPDGGMILDRDETKKLLDKLGILYDESIFEDDDDDHPFANFFRR